MNIICTFLCLIILLNVNVVNASEGSAYLQELTVENYELSPDFDMYNNTYSIDIDQDDTQLNISYVLDDNNAEVEIQNNDLITEKISTVYINVTNNEETQTYKIIVNKNSASQVALIDDELIDVSVDKTYDMKIVITVIVVSWLGCVLILKKIIF